MSENLRATIVGDFVRQRSRNDIIEAVCERGGLNWPEAEELVNQVEVGQAHAIAAGQIPWIAFLSAGTVGLGVLLLNYGIQMIRGIFQGDALSQIVNLGFSYEPISVGFIGLAMIAGGTIGMWKIMLRYFET